MAGTNIYGELIRAQLENTTSVPASALNGRLLFNTTEDIILIDDASTVEYIPTNVSDQLVLAAQIFGD